MERVRIADMAFGGDGVGRLADGSVVFVPYTAVGDDVTIEVTERKASFCRGKVVEVNEGGTGRVEPVCRHFGRCGGCVYQHLSYETEVACKVKQFRDLIGRLGKFASFPEPVVHAAETIYGYRNKLRLEPSERRLENNGYVLSYGYCEKDNETFFKVKSCELVQPVLNKLLPKAVHSDWARQNARREDPYPLTLRVDTEGTTGYYFGKASPKMPWFHETLLGHAYRVPTGSFWQVNPPMAEKLLSTVCGWLTDHPGAALVDAYGGVGTFSLALGKLYPQRWLIECDPAAVTAAEFNHKEAELPGQFMRGNTEDGLDALLQKLPCDKTVVVLDPPRMGCHQKVLESLRKNKVATLLYVSCNVATLARDLRLLCAGDVYVPQQCGVFDMFPRTAHFESAVLLTSAAANH